MIETRQNPDTLQVAVLTVNLEQEVADQVRQMAAAMPWTTVPIYFESYFSAARRPYLTQQAVSSHACIAVVDFDADAALALESVEFLRQSFNSRIAVVGLSSETDPDLLLRSMRAGCNEFLSKPFDPAEFASALERLDKRSSTPGSRQRHSGRVLSFFGAKGGVGTTTLAAHLAIYLVTLCKQKVLLIDNHARLGHVCLYLGLDGNRYHFHELVRNVSRLDHDLLRGFIATHPSGLDVLSSPDVHGSAPHMDAESIDGTLDFLRGEYDFVLLDCETSAEDLNHCVMEISDYVYLVSTPEIGSIRDLSRYVDRLLENEPAADKLQVVINRYSAHEAVSIEQIEKAVRLPIEIKISNSYSRLVRAINLGEPITPDRKVDFSQQLLKWAIALTGKTQADVLPSAKKRFALWK